MSLWSKVRCQECGWRGERLFNFEEDLCLHGCSHCGRKALELDRPEPPERVRPSHVSPGTKADEWLRKALAKAGLGG